MVWPGQELVPEGLEEEDASSGGYWYLQKHNF